MDFRLALACLLIAAPALAAEAPSLTLPLDCRLGETCWLMNYPDTDPGPGARDFRCRPRSYDGHDGTDIALRDHAAMERGVEVRAPAAGRVLRVRDGEEDGLWIAGRQQEIKTARRECGNRVAIAHGDGWVSDLCHLRKGSVRVKAGDVVAAGQPVGLVGLSGMTAFPHAHLGLLKFAPGDNAGTPVDPFTGAELAAGCGRPPAPLWSDSPGYDGVTLYAAGFADRVPDGKAIKADASSPATMPRTAPALVLWAAAFGAAPGDRLRLTLTGPDGTVVATRDAVLDRDQAWRMEAAGKRTPADGWPPGAYRGETRLERKGSPAQVRTITVELR